MKVGATGTALVILLLAVCLIPIPVYADYLTLNTAQGIVGTNVTIPSVTGYGLGNYELYWGETDVLIGQGEVKQGMTSIAFIVPEASRGKHKVTLKIAGTFYTTDFIVIPAIGLSSGQGTVGSNLTIAGKGFNANEPNIQVLYDDNPVQSGIVAGSKGSWQITVKVPASSGGQHTIDAGGSTPASEVEDKTFTVIPEIEINPTSGWVNTVVGIYGSGFASGETNIKVTYDGGTVNTDIAADAKGAWQSSFSIPSSSRGGHEIRSYGAMTNEINIQPASFSVSPGIKIEPVSGYLGGAIYIGDGLYVSGVGFDANETGIKVTYDGALTISAITADTKGSWSSRLDVPSSSKGEHIIDASGEVTKASDIQDAIVIVSPKVELNPSTSVAIGTDVTIHGTGFAANQVITINYDGAKISSNSATDAKGIFTTSFKIPQGKAGDHTVTVTDPTAAVFSMNLSVESVPPPTPNLVSPEAGSEFGSFGKTEVTFSWSAVEDPSEVYYVLEISPSSDFAGTIIRKDSLTATEYTLTGSESLAKGNYYWRVRAVDGAGNQSDWTNGQLFKIGGFDWWLILLIAVGVIVIIGIIWRFVSVGRRGKWK
ncbi:MAG: IPT/TIG domain-containing protein [Dehalococcoidia bacterium]|nr:IPT/TIG domain-containing protein [Dehalococcoidia bacterium]